MITSQGRLKSTITLLTGPRAEVTGAIAEARRSLARYPSEVAMIDILTRPPTPDPMKTNNLVEVLGVSAGSVAGAVLNNSRLPLCSRIVSNPYR